VPWRTCRKKIVPSRPSALRKYSILHRDTGKSSVHSANDDFLTNKMALVGPDSAPDYTIKPQAAAAPIDTSDWPLLLKNYSDRMQRLQQLRSMQLTMRSSRPNRALHSHSCRMLAACSRPEAIC
jgi:hypothetical protein